MFGDFRWSWGTLKRVNVSIQKVLQNQLKTIKTVLLRHLRATRLRFTNLILTSGGDQKSAVIYASKVLYFNIDFYEILIPSLGRNQTFEFQHACAHVGREVRFLLLASGGAQYFDRFEGSF